MSGIDPAGIGTPATTSPAVTAFLTALTAHPAPRVLELGTMRWEPNRPSHHRAWAPHASAYLMSDIAAGPDVDVIADAHDLAPFADGEFDAVIAVSLLEHLRRPWLAAHAIARILAPGAAVYIGTHQCFPLHGYPNDYYRFSASALETLFGYDAGLLDVVTGYQYPATIMAPAEVTRWNPSAEAYLNVDLCARKP